MEKNIFNDFEKDSLYTAERLDGIPSGVSLFMVSDAIKFLYFNRAADEMFGYEKGGLLALTQDDPLHIFHPDYVELLYREIISAMRDGRLFNYDCRILCKDGSYKWTNLSAELVRQKEGSLYFYGVLSPISAPRDTLLKGYHFLIASGKEAERHILSQQIEVMGGTCEPADSALEALDLFASEEDRFDGIFIGSGLVGMNGLELAKDIRHGDFSKGETLPLILLVSPDDSDSIDAAKDIGINLFLKQPIRQEDLAILLVNLMKASR